MATAYLPRPVGRVSDLHASIPDVPVFEGESSLDAEKEAEKFMETFATAIQRADSSSLSALFEEDSWWKDTFTVTSDKRVFDGRSSVVEAWKKLIPTRQPKNFTLTSSGLIASKAAFQRMAPNFATLDAPFSFTTANPASSCVGIAKLVPSGSTWKIWGLTTAIDTLTGYPFSDLPRSSPGLISPIQRGKARPQGLPKVDGMLDAVVIGGGCSGLSNGIMMDSANLDIAIFEAGMSPAWAWATRYKAVRLHHSSFMIQLPQFPVPGDLSDYLSGDELATYMSRAVEELKLPFFAGVAVTSNQWNPKDKCWTVTLKDTSSAEQKETTLKARNLVISNGFLVSTTDPNIPPGLRNQDAFAGTVEHSTTYSTAKAYKDKHVVIVGSGNSAHDIAKDLAEHDTASVTILQRSPTVLFDFDTFSNFVTAPYKGNIPVDTADFQTGGMPAAVFRAMAGGAMRGLIQQSEPLYSKLEAKGYMVDRNFDLVERAHEQRGRAAYFDAPGVFRLVLEDKIKIANGEAVAFVKDGLTAKDMKTGVETFVECDAVILATGFADVDLPQKYAKNGFIDAESAGQLVNMGKPVVDKDGEMRGQLVGSGRTSLSISF